MEEKTVNIIPEGVGEMYHASQGDDGITKRINLTETLTGAEALTLRYQKANGETGSIAVPSTSGTQIDVTIPSEMTDIPGIVYCVLRVNTIGAKSFGLMVERRP